MKRRTFLRLSSMGAIYALASCASPVLFSACRKRGRMMEGVNAPPVKIIEGPFDRVLAIPPVISAQGSLNAQQSSCELFPSKKSAVLGYSQGTILGPTIVAASGETLSIPFYNQLPEPSNIHWHGLSTPADMDGHPENLVQAGASFHYTFPIAQRASMYWYHPHPHGATARQVFKGLAGAFIVRDPEESGLGLPSGEYEVPLVIQDKRFFPDYAIDYSPNTGEIMSGYMGEHIFVNGVHSPYLNVSRSHYRLRVLNGSNARIYNLSLSDQSYFTVIGSDGGLLPAPETLNSLLLGPGERADIIVNFTAYAINSELYLLSKTFDGGKQGTQEFRILKFSVKKNDTSVLTIPASLSSIAPIPVSSASTTRTFEISNAGHGGHGAGMHGGHRINGKSYNPSIIDERVSAGNTEIWVFDNSAGEEPHPMHIHGMQFQVLERSGGRNKIIATEKGWKDTVMLMPGEKVKTIMKFHQNKGKYVVHCHNLEHEEDGMMLQFEIV